MKTEHTESWHWSYSSAEEFAQRLMAANFKNVHKVFDRDEKGRRVYIVHGDAPTPNTLST